MRKTLASIARLRCVSWDNMFRRRVCGTNSARQSPTDANGDQATATPNRRRILLISGESHTPGHVYRVLRLAKALETCGETVAWLRLEDCEDHREEVSQATIIFIWRVPFSAMMSGLIESARAAGAKVIFDLDDLMLKPELARIDIIDGIRSQGFNADETARLFGRIQKLMLQADTCTCTTNELADHIREYQMIAYVLPNGFDDAAHLASRLAVRYRRIAAEEPVIRIGYASGSRTHQRDFGQTANAIARLLQERPSYRLVLFRDQISFEPVLDPGEFPNLRCSAHQIEWREIVPLSRLPQEIARFDINLVPLELGNPFCEAKSELKYL